MDEDLIIISSDETEETETSSKKLAPHQSVEDKTQGSNVSLEKNYDSPKNNITQDKFLERSSLQSDNEVKAKPSSFGITENTSEDISDAFEKFLNIVLPMEKNNLDRAKLFKKFKKYYNSTDPNYLNSPEFSNLLEKCIAKVNQNPLFLYFMLKEVSDCLLSKQIVINSGKKFKKEVLGSGSTPAGVDQKVSSEYSDDIQFDEDEKNYKTVKRLSRVLRKLEKKIKKLEEMEVDLNDEENSAFLKMQRYRERFCQVYKKLCAYTSHPSDAGRIFTSKKVNFTGTDNLQLDRSIENWLNKTNRFPDFTDVFKLIGDLNDSLSLGLMKDQVKTKAQDVFAMIGSILQRRRKYSLWDLFSSFLDDSIDPAIDDPELQLKLDRNRKIAMEKEDQLIDYYVQMQNNDNLEPVEVPEEEANNSPVESGDEDENEIEEAEKILCSDSAVENEDSAETEEENSNDSLLSCGNEVVIDQKRGDKNTSHDMGSTSIESSILDAEALNNEPKKEAVTLPFERFDKYYFTNSTKPCFEFCKFKEDLSLKRQLESEDSKCVKKPKFNNENRSDSDSDVVIMSEDEENSVKRKNNTPPPKYTVNYAFINHRFNQYSFLSKENDFFRKRNSTFSNCMIRRISSHICPLIDLTNTKCIVNKCQGFSEIKERRKMHYPLYRVKFPKKVSYAKPRHRHHTFILFSNTSGVESHSEEENIKQQNKREEITKEEAVKRERSKGSGNAPNSAGSGEGRDNDGDNSENNGSKQSIEKEQEKEGGEEGEDEEQKDGVDAVEVKEENEKKADIIMAEVSVPDKKSETNSSQCHSPKTEIIRNQNVHMNNESDNLDEEITIESDSEICYLEDVENNKVSKDNFLAHSTVSINSDKNISESSSSCSLKKYSKCDIKTKRDGAPFRSLKQYHIFKIDTDSRNLESVKNYSSPQKSSAGKNYEDKGMTISVKRSKSDEEIVKNFLERSPPSISIIRPKIRASEKKQPAPSVLQALETLSKLKGISTTIVKCTSKCKTDDINKLKNTGCQQLQRLSKRKQLSSSSSPSDAESVNFLIPKIVTVQGNVSGFENIVDDNLDIFTEGNELNCVDSKTDRLRKKNNSSDSSKVENYNSNNNIPVPRFQNIQSISRSHKTETVEYVVLD